MELMEVEEDEGEEDKQREDGDLGLVGAGAGTGRILRASEGRLEVLGLGTGAAKPGSGRIFVPAESFVDLFV